MNMPARDRPEPAGCRVDKRLVGRSFGRAAPGYDAVAQLQRQVGDRVLAELVCAYSPASVVDVGAGTGYCTRQLMERFPGGQVIALDLAESMLHRARAEASGAFGLICADVECMPLAGDAVDLVFSNLALQWCHDLAAVFAECLRVLKPGGRLAFSSFGPATLQELREAWAKVDNRTHVMAFRTPQQVASAMAVAGFADVDVRSEVKVLGYATVDALMRELKGLGAHNVTEGRPRHLTGKRAMRAMMEAYGPRAADGLIQASFEILYAHGRRR